MIDIAGELYLCNNTDELKGLIERLGKEREELNEEFNEEINEKVADRLRETADLMADLGRIHPTPQAKRQWIDQILAG